MALFDGLAENTRRNERVERGTVAVTGSATVGLGPSGSTVNLGAAGTTTNRMRQITHFQLTLDDSGGSIAGTDIATVTGSLNAAGTVLTIKAWKATNSSTTTLIATTAAFNVRYMLFGNLSAGQGF